MDRAQFIALLDDMYLLYCIRCGCQRFIERCIKVLQNGNPFFVAFSYFIEVFLHACRKVEVDDLGKVRSAVQVYEHGTRCRAMTTLSRGRSVFQSRVERDITAALDGRWTSGLYLHSSFPNSS